MGLEPNKHFSFLLPSALCPLPFFVKINLTRKISKEAIQE
ncbi:hypothetical protein FDUTEX481_09451 [Tolypothrix sp. PCC 7601]|nr:hypothetical protein FDUTEX481_09451 [Tolypothrix sp. PCC 7601]